MRVPLGAVEKAKAEQEAHGEFVSKCPGYCGAQDTFYVGTLKGGGRSYQQTFSDTYREVAFAKLSDRKTPLVAADLLNDQVVLFWSLPSYRSRASCPSGARKIVAVSGMNTSCIERSRTLAIRARRSRVRRRTAPASAIAGV